MRRSTNLEQEFAGGDVRGTKLAAVRRWRSVWLQTHLWVGLVAGLILSLIALSGALLVFLGPLSRAEIGQLFAAPPNATGDWRSPGQWIEAAKTRYPEIEDVGVVYGPGAGPVHADVPLLMAHVHKPGGGELHALIGVEPVSGEPLGLAIVEHTWSAMILYFHVMLLLGPAGRLLVSWSGVLFFVSLATGLYLWWPRKRRWKNAFTVRRGARGRALLLDLHNVSALWLLAPTVVVVFTGVYMMQPDWFDPAVRQVATMREPDWTGLRSSPAGTCGEPPTIDRALEIARAGRTEQTLRVIWVPEQPDAPTYVILGKSGAEPRAKSTIVAVDRNCPKILFERDGDTLSWAEAFKSWLRPLHADLGLGLVGQAFVLLAGILLPFLYITGIILWLKRRG
jgi:uncharacterized iron-regulated membrane protein